jgi:hypothetical protein
MSLEYLMDRLAIQDTLTRFSTAIDTRKLELLDQVFAADAVLDYGSYWGPGDFEGFKQWAEVALKNFSAWQHLLANMVIEIDGDTATSMTDFYNPIISGDAGTEQTVLHAYGRYHDALRRTADGWRITRRRMEPLSGLDPAQMR